jgi:hypothetical protein
MKIIWYEKYSLKIFWYVIYEKNIFYGLGIVKEISIEYLWYKSGYINVLLVIYWLLVIYTINFLEFLQYEQIQSHIFPIQPH